MNSLSVLRAICLSLLIFLTPSCTNRRHQTVERYYHEVAQATESHNFAQALKYAQKAASLQPSPRSLALKATLLYQNGKLQESKKTFELTLQQKNISPVVKASILNNYAVVLAHLGYHHKARTLWKELSINRYYSTPEVAWFNLGLLAWKEREQKKRRRLPTSREEKAALHYFSKAISLEPAYVDAYFLRAQVLVAQKRKIEALTALKKVLLLAPHHTEAKKMVLHLKQSKRS